MLLQIAGFSLALRIIFHRFLKHMDLIWGNIYLEVGLLDHMVVLFLFFFFMVQGFIKSYMQNILLIALAKDQCKNTPQFCNCQFKKFCSSG